MNVQRTQAVGNQGMGRQNLTFGQIKGGDSAVRAARKALPEAVVDFLDTTVLGAVDVIDRGTHVNVRNEGGEIFKLQGRNLTNSETAIQSLRRFLGMGEEATA